MRNAHTVALHAVRLHGVCVLEHSQVHSRSGMTQAQHHPRMPITQHNLLQRSTTCCNAAQPVATQCTMLQRSTVCCNAAQSVATQCTRTGTSQVRCRHDAAHVHVRDGGGGDKQTHKQQRRRHRQLSLAATRIPAAEDAHLISLAMDFGGRYTEYSACSTLQPTRALSTLPSLDGPCL